MAEPVEIFIDHKSLTSLFHEAKGVPALASACIQRWSLTLNAYSYKLKFRSGKNNCTADALSRLPLPGMPACVTTPPDTVLLLEYLDSIPVTAKQIKVWTNHDPVLSRVRKYILHGWPDHKIKDCELNPYKVRQHELSTQDGCILWGSRIIFPKQGQTQVIKDLHASHPGISRMKALA